MSRVDGRAADQLRTVTFQRGWSDHAEGSVLVSFGRTRVLCNARGHGRKGEADRHDPLRVFEV